MKYQGINGEGEEEKVLNDSWIICMTQFNWIG